MDPKKLPKCYVGTEDHGRGSTLTTSNLIFGLRGPAKALKLVILTSYGDHLAIIFTLFHVFTSHVQSRFQWQPIVHRSHEEVHSSRLFISQLNLTIIVRHSVSIVLGSLWPHQGFLVSKTSPVPPEAHFDLIWKPIGPYFLPLQAALNHCVGNFVS